MNEEFLKKLQALKQEYIDSLPGLLQQIKVCTDVLIAEGPTAIDLDEYYRLTHSLTGSGATYGFAFVSDSSRNMENCIKELFEVEAGQHESIVAEIQGLYDLLERAIQAAISDDDIYEEESSADQIKTENWKILIADDEMFSRKQLATLLESKGHTVVQAEDGVDALEKFATEKPDMVILDVIMPRMNGLECARQLKRQSQERFVPIIFLTSLEREEELVDCIRSGGDEFIVKPYNKVILNARIFAMQRIQKLHAELEKYQHDTEQELSLARHVFENATQRNRAGTQALVKWIEACGHFSGDVLCYRQSAAGDLYIMLGDFTGHGLRAAIGALPASDIFYSMVKGNCSLDEIVRKINQKLKNLLPTGQFMCGSFMRLNGQKTAIEVVVAGLPPVVIKDIRGNVDLVESSCLPLGVMDSTQLEVTVQEYSTERMQGIFTMSDGIIEAANAHGQMYGQARLIEILMKAVSVSDAIAELNRDFRDFLGELEPDDDISILGVPLG